ncbi:MAG: nicotinamide-nucleotide amidohydrolase family protein [Anaerolineales bacterium]|nr:nicotinamide-nucleotide amidohydrolase family protein [Anaerolineales bacterium]
MANLLEEQIGSALRERGLKIALAESCTGGLAGSRITDMPGSSDYFLGSLVAYAYDAKANLLDVSWNTLNTYGAVSQETVLEMARGARSAFGADIAVSISGIAGPGGGLPAKPVGTVWLGLVAPNGEWARMFQFSGSRVQVKAASADAALQFVSDYLQGMV